MDNEGKFWIGVWSIIAAVVALGMTFLYYDGNVVPQRMAEKGYCWTVLNRQNALPTGAYQPCKPEAPK